MTHRKHTALRTALLLDVVFGPLVLVAVGLRYLVVRVERGEMVGVSQAIVLGVPAVVVLAMAVWVYRSASKLRASSMTPAQRLMLRQLNEDTTLTFPAFYLGPQPVGTDGAPMTDKVSLVVTCHTVSVRPGAGVGTVLCDADGARVRSRLLPDPRVPDLHVPDPRIGERQPGPTVPGLAVAHPSLLYPQAVGSLEAERRWEDGPEALTAYAQQVALETGLDAGELADALLSGDARRVAAPDAAARGYLGQMVPGPGGGVVFRAPEMRLVVADPERPSLPADEVLVGKVALAVRQTLEGPGAPSQGAPRQRGLPSPVRGLVHGTGPGRRPPPGPMR